MQNYNWIVDKLYYIQIQMFKVNIEKYINVTYSVKKKVNYNF